MRFSPFSRSAHRRKTTTSSSVCRSCYFVYAGILSCSILQVSASALSATPTPNLYYNPRELPEIAYHKQPSLPTRSNQQQHIGHQHQPRHPRPEPTPAPAPVPNPAPAQFWAGWPKETITSIRTVTLTEPGVIGGVPALPDTTTTETAEATTTIYDSNIPASGTLTVISTVTVSPGGVGGGGVIETVSTTTVSNTAPNQSGTLTRTRTATIQTRLPQETAIWTPADIPRFAECLPGDEDYEEPGVLSLTKEQRPTLIALAIMFVVILIGWNFVIIRDLLYPLKVSFASPPSNSCRAESVNVGTHADDWFHTCIAWMVIDARTSHT